MAVEYIKEGAFTGYKVVTTREESMEWTHVAIPRKEYYDLLNKIEQAKNDAAYAFKDAEDEIARVNEAADAEIESIRAEAQAENQELQQALAAAQKEAAYQKDLNKSLLWMSKKRANAERDLRPKTEHSGYAVLSSVERDHSFGVGKNRRTVRVWETVMQTPFSVDFTEEQAKTETKGLFVQDEDGQWPIGKIGINAHYPKGYAALVKDCAPEEWQPCNVLFDKKYRANHKAGYWEMLLWHTRCLGVVPEDMRPTQPKKG